MTHIIGGVGGKVRYWMLRHGSGTGLAKQVTDLESRLVKCCSVSVVYYEWDGVAQHDIACMVQWNN